MKTITNLFLFISLTINIFSAQKDDLLERFKYVVIYTHAESIEVKKNNQTKIYKSSTGNYFFVDRKQVIDIIFQNKRLYEQYEVILEDNTSVFCQNYFKNNLIKCFYNSAESKFIFEKDHAEIFFKQTKNNFDKFLKKK